MRCLRPLVLLSLLAASRAPPPAEDSDLGKCICDYTSGQCDAHCCCDPDCQESVLGDLRRSFDCLEEGPANRSSHRCYSKGWVRNINPRADFSVIADDLRGLLCVEVDNNPVEGTYFTNSPKMPASKIEELQGERRLSSWASARADEADTSSTTSARGYLAADPLKVHMALSQQSGTIAEVVEVQDLRQPGFVEVVADLPIRSADFFGACDADPGQPARFLADVPPVSCWLGPVDLSQTCGSTLSPRSLGNWFVRTLDLPEDMRCDVGRCIAPNVTVLCSPAEGLAGDAAVAACPATAPVDPKLEIVDGSCICRGAVRDVAYTFWYRYDSRYGGVAVSKAEIRVALQDVRSEACQQQPVSVPQTTSVRFLQESDQPATRERSGNPGYQAGLPLLVASCARFDQVNGRCAQFDGLSHGSGAAVVRGIRPDGSCAELGNATGRGPKVNFGEEALFGCTLDVTRAQLASLCAPDVADGTGSLLQRLGILSFPWTHIAAFGNVPHDSQDPRDWVEISTSSEQKPLAFSDDSLLAGTRASDSTCLGAVVGLDLEVLYSPFGEVRNPQLRVVAARLSRRFGALAFTRLDPAEPQTFQFTFTAAFVRLDDTSDPETEVPPRPPLPRILPHDLFYPFRLGSLSASRWSWPQASLLLVLVIGALRLE